MSYPRVNLLKKNEQRYQGVVSQRFLFIASVLVPVVIVVLAVVIQQSKYREVKKSLEASRASWQQLEPKLTEYRKEKGGLQGNQELLNLLEAWDKSRPALFELMDDLQGVVPWKVQLKRLTLRSRFGSAIAKTPADLKPSVLLVVEGVSQGDRAENEVIQLRKDLLGCARVSDVFDSVKLASMRRSRGDSGIDQREFRLEGEVLEGGRK